MTDPGKFTGPIQVYPTGPNNWTAVDTRSPLPQSIQDALEANAPTEPVMSGGFDANAYTAFTVAREAWAKLANDRLNVWPVLVYQTRQAVSTPGAPEPTTAPTGSATTAWAWWFMNDKGSWSGTASSANQAKSDMDETLSKAGVTAPSVVITTGN